MLGRVYNIPFYNVTISAAQDLFLVNATSSMAFDLLSIELNAIGATSAEELHVLFKLSASAVTAGTGGASVTPVSTYGSVAATVTAYCNATSRATGTFTNWKTAGWQLTNGYVYQFMPEEVKRFTLSQALLIGLETAPAASHSCSGTITIAEIV